MDQSWTLKTLFEALGMAEPSNLPDIKITSIQTNPKSCAPGSLFIGVAFVLAYFRYKSEEQAIQEAISNGASAVLTSQRRLSFRPPVPVMKAKNTIDVIAKLAVYARKKLDGKVIAITGSTGKTSTKDVIGHSLSQLGSTYQTIDSRNAISGVCQTIVNAPVSSDYLVVEVGASSVGHLQHAIYAEPNIGIITNVGITHLENYNNRAELYKEKLSLFDYLIDMKTGITHESVVKQDADQGGLLTAKKLSKLITVGEAPDNDIYCTNTSFNGVMNEGIMQVFGTPYPFQLNLPAPHFVNAAMFAVATAAALDLDINKVIASFSELTITARRFERFRIKVKEGDIELVDDSCNAAPQTMRAVLNSFSYRKTPRKVFIWGDMNGLGDDTAIYHSQIASEICGAGFGLILTVGKKTKDAFHDISFSEKYHFDDNASLSATFGDHIQAGDLIAVKGSTGMKFGEVAESIKLLGDCVPAGSWMLE